ncbi:MAG: carotenoid biosynthesis protein [Bacteroidales bacterium]|nr:carotenoid biosynthesis protein [Bacteroidales bacterium]
MIFFLFKRNAVVVFLLTLFFAVGIIAHLIPYTRNMVLGLTEIFLISVNSIAIYYVFIDNKYKWEKLLLWLVITYLSTLLIEIVGVKTGQVFGSYVYGSTMKIKVFQVPVVIALNWVVLILGSHSLIASFVKNAIFRIFLSSLFLVLLDYFIEPVAINFDYWSWFGSEIPLEII